MTQIYMPNGESYFIQKIDLETLKLIAEALSEEG